MIDGEKMCVSLRDKILRTVILAHRKARNIGAHRRKRIGGWTGAEHVAEIESVGMGKIVIEAQSELIVVLAESLRGDVSVFADVRQREKRQDTARRGIDRGDDCRLVEGHRLAEIGELPLGGCCTYRYRGRW